MIFKFVINFLLSVKNVIMSFTDKQTLEWIKCTSNHQQSYNFIARISLNLAEKTSLIREALSGLSHLKAFISIKESIIFNPLIRRLMKMVHKVHRSLARKVRSISDALRICGFLS